MSKVLVNIHGAGKEMSDFYVEGLKALTAILGAAPACLPCWYANLSNIGSAVFGIEDPGAPSEATEFRNQLWQEINTSRQEIEAEADPTQVDFGLVDSAAIIADLVTDVMGYVFDSRLQADIQQLLKDILAKATADYDETILVSHSLGTVVAFDVLRQNADRYKISKFITMGSPLRKLVRLGRRSSGLGAINHSTVPLWRNLYDTTDPVANPIGPAFPGYPIEDVFIDVATAPLPSHDYWRNSQVLQMIADTLRP
ncbi:MAG: hypothetical protein EXR62_10585 [Chloroflexi bacterium]|nr:hypothetical protein [Chloroflexota bacterium]